MLPIVEYPSIIEQYSEYFKDIFSSKEVFEHFKRYVTGLIISENKTIERINELYVLDSKDQSSLNRLLTEYKWSKEQLNKRRIELIKSAGFKSKGVLIIDDTLNEKYGKHFEKIAKLKDPKDKRYILAHDIVTLHYSDQLTDQPIDYLLYEQLDIEDTKELLKQKGVLVDENKLNKFADSKKRLILLKLLKKNKIEHSFLSKLELAKQLIDSALQFGFNNPVSFDGWFSAKEFCNYLDSKNLMYVGTLQDNRQIFVDNKWLSISDYAKSLKENSLELFKEIEIKHKGKKETYLAYCKTLRISKLGKKKVVISYKVKPKDKEEENPKFFVTNSKIWDTAKILTVRRFRSDIETFYEDSQGLLELEAYQLRDLEGIKKHWYLVFLAYSLLRLQTYNKDFSNWFKAKLQTIGDGVRNANGDVLNSLVIFLFQLFHRGKTPLEAVELLIP